MTYKARTPSVKLRNSIAVRYLSVVGTFLLTAQLLFGLSQTYLAYQQQLSDLQHAVELQANFLSAVSPEIILRSDFLALETLMQKNAHDPDSVYGVVINPEGRPLTRFFNPDNPHIKKALATSPTNQDILSLIRTVQQDPLVREIRADIVVQDERLGEIRLGYSIANIRQRAVSATAITLVVAVMVGLVLSGLTIILLNRQVMSPLRALADLARTLAGGDLRQRADVRRGDEISLLGRSFNSMADQLQRTLEGLEQRVTDRTRDIVVAVEVGQRAVRLRDLDDLLAETVELIRSRFDLYYTQVYLAEPNGRVLLMRAGTGQVGQELQRRGLRLAFGVGSLNGTAAAERRPVIVSNTATAPNFHPNPLLPDTRSEMCVPLLSGDRLLGVLDLQSSRPDAFSEDNLPAFEMLAGQLVAAIQNAELFTATEQAKAQIEQQARRTAHSNWREFLNAVERQEQFGFTYTNSALTVLSTAPLTPASNRPTLTTPLLVAGEPVGELHLEGDAETTWTASEQELLNTVARQVAQQLENLRLLAQAEDYQRQAEAALRRLTREGWEEHASARPGYLYELNQEVSPLAETAPDDMALTQPLTVHGETIGELALTGVERADDETAELVSAVADKLTAHIENLRLFDQTQTALREAETLFAVTSHLSNAATLREIAEAMAFVGQDTRIAGVTIQLYSHTPNGEPEWQELAAHWAHDPGAAYLKAPLGSRLRIADSPLAQLLAQATTVTVCDDVLTDPRVDEASRASLNAAGARAAAFLPLTSGNQRLGYVRLTWETPRAFTPIEVRLYEATARNASVSVSNRLLFEQTQKRADRETVINTINQKIQSATSVEGALQIAARELGQRLKIQRATVEIGADGNGNH